MKAYIYRTHYKEKSEEILIYAHNVTEAKELAYAYENGFARIEEIFVKRANYLDDDSKTEATISPIEKE